MKKKRRMKIRLFCGGYSVYFAISAAKAME